MRSKRPIIRQCKNLAKQHVDNPDEPAPDGASGFAEWTQIAFILLHAELDKMISERLKHGSMTPEPSVKSLTSTNRRITPRSVDGSNRSTCVNSAACSAAVRSRLAGREQQQSTPVASSEIKPAIITGIVLASRFTS